MKKEYLNPEIEIISLKEEDIIVTSNMFGGNSAGDKDQDYEAWKQSKGF